MHHLAAHLVQFDELAAHHLLERGTGPLFETTRQTRYSLRRIREGIDPWVVVWYQDEAFQVETKRERSPAAQDGRTCTEAMYSTRL